MQLMNTYQEFIEQLLEILENNYGLSGTLDQLKKNNQTVYDVIYIQDNERSCSPVFYLDSLYNDYLKEYQIDEIAKKVFETYEEHKDDYAFLNHSWLTDYAALKSSVVLRIINAEYNKELLEEMPHIKILDLAITFRLLIAHQDEVVETMAISQQLFEEWNISIETLYIQAVKNMKRLYKQILCPIQEMIEHLCREQLEMPEFEEKSVPMYVLTNHMQAYGAAEFCYTNVLEKLSEELNADLLILPSSVHEVIIIPDFGDMHSDGLKQIVGEVNNEIVGHDDVLSEHVYKFILSEKRLKIEI